MSRTVYRISIVLSAFWLLAANPASASDPPPGGSDDFNRWIPSIALTLGFMTQVHEGTVDSSFRRHFGFGVFGNPIPIDDREFAEGQQSFTTLIVGGTVELQTPRLLPHHWSPRLFVSGEILNVSAQSRPIAREGDPSGLDESDDTVVFPATAILGQGSTTLSDADTVLYGASLGISIPIRVGDWRISIKPSARYLNQEINFRGIVLDAFRRGVLNDQPPTREIEIFADDSLDVHAVGPGLEIEIEAARVGSLAASVFVSGGAYRVLSDRRIDFGNSVQNNVNPGDFGDLGNIFRGDFTAEIDPWIYRANLGFRVKWLGLPSGWLGRGRGR